MEIQKFKEGKGKKYSDQIRTCGPIQPNYFYALEDPYYSKCLGWRGPGVSEIPDTAYYLSFAVTISKDQIETLFEGIHHRKGREDYSHHIDNGIWYTVEPIKIKDVEYKTITYPRVVKKKPWFDDVLQAIQKHKPEFTEEDLINEHENLFREQNCGNPNSYDSSEEEEYTTNMIEEIIPAGNKQEIIAEAEYDKDRVIITVGCMNDDIPKHKEKLLKILNHAG